MKSMKVNLQLSISYIRFITACTACLVGKKNLADFFFLKKRARRGSERENPLPITFAKWHFKCNCKLDKSQNGVLDLKLVYSEHIVYNKKCGFPRVVAYSFKQARPLWTDLEFYADFKSGTVVFVCSISSSSPTSKV